MVRLDEECHGMVGIGRYGVEWRVGDRLGRAGEVWRVGSGAVWLGRRGSEWSGTVR